MVEGIYKLSSSWRLHCTIITKLITNVSHITLTPSLTNERFNGQLEGIFSSLVSSLTNILIHTRTHDVYIKEKNRPTYTLKWRTDDRNVQAKRRKQKNKQPNHPHVCLELSFCIHISRSFCVIWRNIYVYWIKSEWYYKFPFRCATHRKSEKRP